MIKTRNYVRAIETKAGLQVRSGNPAMIHSTLAHQVGRSPTVERADMMSMFGGMGGMNGTSIVGVGQSPVFYDTMLTGFASENDDANQKFYRDIYMYDTVAGSTVDLMAGMPYSDFSLSGVDDARLQVYEEACNQLNLQSLFQEITVDMLVHGFTASSLLYNSSKKQFQDILSHDPMNCLRTPVPFRSHDPIVKVRRSNSITQFLSSSSPTIDNIKSALGHDVLAALNSDVMELEPIFTIYMARRAFSHDPLGISLFRRILPIYFIEKALYKGTMVEAGRRQRSLLHLETGNDTWEPTNEELSAVVSVFQQADLDPLGAIIATRQGITPNELRQGGDFWKWTDITDVLNPMKMRSMGVSEGFLSGDACMVGSTLVPTKEHGLVRIDEICDSGERDRKMHSLNVTVASRYGNEKTSGWLYNGKRDTVKITTNLGNTVTCTPNHPLLVLEPDTLETTWVRQDRLYVGSFLCVPTLKCVRISRLELDLSEHMQFRAQDNSANYLKRPSVMTPELAFFLGMLIAEGSTSKNGIAITNGDLALLEKTADCMEEVFGHRPNFRQLGTAGTPYCIQGVEGTSNFDHHQIDLGSLQLLKWLDELGVSKKTAAHKDVPWCILQADEKSQLAFLAAYLEGDGSIHKKDGRLLWISKSKKIVAKIQVMLNAFGVLCTRRGRFVEVSGGEAGANLWPKLKPFMVTKSFDYDSVNYKARSRYGIPLSGLHEFLKSRFQFFNRHGATYLDDSGEQVLVKRVGLYHKSYLYDCHDSGYYDDFLAALKVISKSMHAKLLALVKLRYRFPVVVSMKDAGKRDVFDISMGDKEPAFVANGLLVHNTFSNAENGMSVFMESQNAQRNRTTNAVLYNKVFPLVAGTHGFEKTQKQAQETAFIAGDPRSYSIHKKLNNTNRWDIPTVTWIKTLARNSDQTRLELLKELRELEVPIPLRMLAAAADVDLEGLEDDLKKETMLKKKWAAAMGKDEEKEPKERSGDDESEGGDDFEMSSLSQLAGRRRIPILARKFDGRATEVVGETKTGKPKYIHNQREAAEKLDMQFVMAASRLHSDPKYARQVAERARKAGFKAPGETP